MNALNALVFKNLYRNKNRTLLQGLLIFFAAFVMTYFSQFLAGITKNFTTNIVSIASGEIYLSSPIDEGSDNNIFDREYDFIELSENELSELRNWSEIESVNSRLEFPVRISTSDDTIITSMSAFDVQSENRMAANLDVREGRMLKPGSYEAILPQDFARRNDIKVGDTISVLANTVDKKMNLIPYKVVGTFKSINLSAWFDNYVFTDSASARVLINSKVAHTRVNIHLTEDAELEVAKKKVQDYFDSRSQGASENITVTDWKEGAKFFTSLIFGIEAGFFIIVGIICNILFFTIGFTTIMAVVERAKEIATLGALGATPRRIRKLIMTENILLTDISSASAIAIAGICFYITKNTGVPINNSELEGFLGASHFYPAFDIAGFIVPFFLCKMVTANVTFFVSWKVSKSNISDALAK